MTALLGTSSDGSPVLELVTPKGQQRWVYAFGPDGPIPVEIPKRAKKGQDTPSDHVPAWVEAAVQHWWASLKRIETELAPRQDAVRDLDQMAAMLVTSFGHALLFENPPLRKTLLSFTQTMHRRSRQHGTPPDIQKICAERSSQLADLLRRTKPASSIREESPTDQTKARLQDHYLKRLADAANLTPEQMDAAQAIAEIVHDLVKRLDIKASDLEPSGRGSTGAVQQPITALSNADFEYLQEIYTPWSKRMHAIPATVDKWRADQRIAAPAETNYTGATYYSVTRAMVCEGLMPAQADRKYKLVDGRAALILRWALDAYPRVPRIEFS